MTVVSAPAASASRSAAGPGARAAARLLRLELRRNAMLWMLPAALALFWFTTYRKAMAMPPLWSLRAASCRAARSWRSCVLWQALPRGWGQGNAADNR